MPDQAIRSDEHINGAHVVLGRERGLRSFDDSTGKLPTICGKSWVILSSDFTSGLRHSLSDFHQVIADFGDGEHRNRRLAGPLLERRGRDCNEAARQFMTH